MTTAYKWFTEYLALTGSGHSGTNWQCPAHPDGSPSMAVNEGPDGMVLIFCHGGCELQAILDQLGIAHDVLFDVRTRSPQQVLAGQIQQPKYEPFTYHRGGSSRLGAAVSIEHHVYVPGRIRLERRRYAGNRKQIRWEERRGSDWAYAKNLQLATLPLYCEPDVCQAVAGGETVILCESESSVDALMSAGFYATTWAGGAANPNVERMESVLAGGRVVLIPDNDPAGEKCRGAIVPRLSSCADLRVLMPPAARMDARNLLDAIGSRGLKRELDALWHLPMTG